MGARVLGGEYDDEERAGDQGIAMPERTQDAAEEKAQQENADIEGGDDQAMDQPQQPPQQEQRPHQRQPGENR